MHELVKDFFADTAAICLSRGLSYQKIALHSIPPIGHPISRADQEQIKSNGFEVISA
jgi:hypothetical protein